MKILRVHSDNEYWALLPVERTAYLSQKLFQVEPMRPSWSPMSFYVRDPVRAKKGNFHNLSLGSLAHDNHVHDSPLGALLLGCGEVLEAKIDGVNDELHVFNCTTCYDCLDREGTSADWTPDKITAIQIQVRSNW
jgi:hypothetical protein